MTWYTATQPLLFPYIHMVERFARCDHVVVLHEAQFTRDKMSQVIISANGPVKLSAPLHKAGRRAFCEVMLLDPQRWRAQLMKTVAIVYGKQAGWRRHGDDLLGFLETVPADGMSTATLGHRCIEWCRDVLGLEFSVHASRDLIPQRPGNPCAWMRSFAEPLKATDYLQGAASIGAYFVPGIFPPVRVWGQDFTVPVHRQLSKGFQPLVSVLDPLLVHGAEFVRDLIQAGAGPGKNSGSVIRMHDV